MPFNFLKNIKEKYNIKKEYVVLAVFAMLIALFYGNTLLNGFVLDDKMVVEENIYIHSLRYSHKIVTGCIWEYALGGCKDKTLHYRPIHSLSYLLTYQISSSAWFFHLVNLLYYLCAVFLVFILFKKITKNFTLSFFTALIFLIHPINSEPVNWISAVSELTFLIFVLLTLIYYVKYRENGSTKNLFWVYLLYFLAMLSKEPAVVLPLVLISYDLLFFEKNIKELIQWKKLKRYLLFLVPVLVYFSMRQAVIGGFGGLIKKESYLGGFAFLERIYVFFTLFVYYLQKIFYPFPLNFYHDFKIRSELLNFQFISSFVGVFVFFIILYFFIKKGKNLLAFSLIWFLIFLFPVLLFFNVAGESVFAERYLLVPGVGFALIIGYFLDYLWRKNRTAKIIASILVISLIVISWQIVFQRNKIWKDDKTLFRATLSLNPNAHKIREYLAGDLKREGDWEAAKIEYEEIIRRNPRWMFIDHIYNNLGDYWRENNNPDRAIEYYQKAIEVSKGENYKSYNNIGGVYMQKKDYLKALTYFCKALQIDPEAKEPKYNFSRIASMIRSVDEENFLLLYMDIMKGGVFKKTEQKKIKYKSKVCIATSCSYAFIPLVEKNEVLLPFLIMAKTLSNEIIRVKNPSFNSITGEIIVNLDSKHKDAAITFIFPTCNGIYYQVEAK